MLVNIIWLIVSGLPLALEHAVFGCILCVTIIGIPFGLQHFKTGETGIDAIWRGSILKMPALFRAGISLSCISGSRYPGASLIDLLQNTVRLLALGRSGLVIIIIVIRRDGAGDNIRHIILFQSVLINCKGLLENHGIHIAGVGIALRNRNSPDCKRYFFLCILQCPGEREDDGRRQDLLPHLWQGVQE